VINLSATAAGLLEALDEPALLIDPEGTILCANRALVALVGRPVGGSVLDLHRGDAGALHVYLQRCLGSRQPLVGMLAVSGVAGDRRLPCRGSLVTAAGERAVLLRTAHQSEDRFAALNGKVRQLNAELRERWKAKALLEETLCERELLMNELQHRVKNNMHMLAGMLTAAEREADTPEAKAALRDMARRFEAVNAVQQLLYNSSNLDCIGSDALIVTLLRAATSIAPDAIESRLSVDPVTLPIEFAIPIALILNELLTNAVKYGRQPGLAHCIMVAFLGQQGQIQIVVEDHGPGFMPVEGPKRASGLGLVRGLLRQLGGSIAVEHGIGARCVVSIPHPHARRLAATN
jgi:two-component sensor histidine kinase